MVRWNLTIACVCVARLTHANPAAEKLFQDGRTALAANQLDAACDAFRRSEELEPRIGTLLNLGDCEERRNHLASAWNAFSDAKGLAVKDRDEARGVEAGRRAKALEPKLPYLTLTVARVTGLVIHRNDTDVPSAEWDHEVPLDAGSYQLSASAPGFKPWSTTIDVVESQHLRVDVPALDAIPVEAPPVVAVDKPVVTQIVDPPPAAHVSDNIAVGAFTGMTPGANWVNGVRVVLNAAPVGAGVLRVVPQLAHWEEVVDNDAMHTRTSWDIGATLEYAYSITDKLVAAGGVGGGIELFSDSYADNMAQHNGWVGFRLSPTLRLDRLDIALHYQFSHSRFVDGNQAVNDRWISQFEVGVDFFVW